MSNRAVYDHPLWRKVRRAVLERDGYRCMIRLEGCTGRATQVDHILPLHQGGRPFDQGNLRAACQHCNLVRSHPLATEAPAPPPRLRW